MSPSTKRTKTKRFNMDDYIFPKDTGEDYCAVKRLYTFKGDFGTKVMTHDEFIQSDIKSMVRDPDYRFLNLGLTNLVYSKAFLKLERNAKESIGFQSLREMYDENPLRFFLPSGAGGVNFLNDTDHSVKAMIAPNRIGKALHADETVQTPSGEMRIGSLKVGDKVLGGDGKPCNVTGVYHQGIIKLNLITFENGETSILACDNHQWKYLSHSRAFRHKDRAELTFNKWEVVTTMGMIAAQGRNANAQKKGFIPQSGVAEFSGQAALDPYTFGVLLGDGCLCGGTLRLLSADQEIVDSVNKVVGNCLRQSKSRHYDYRISDGGKLKAVLKALKIYGKHSWDKFIPNEMRYIPSKDRLEMLRGLMDTDGTISTQGTDSTYCSTSFRLAHGLAWLVRSLGGKASVNSRHTWCKGKCGRLSYRVGVRMDVNPFRLKRKADLWRHSGRRMDRLVCGIEEWGNAPATCISVDSHDNTFLCRDFIVTHNTAHMVVDKLLDAIPTAPSWYIFQRHWVHHRKWAGPMKLGFATADWNVMRRTLWPEIRKWIPKYELGPFDPRRRDAKEIAWRNEPSIKLQCGTEIFFFVYEQKQGPYESQALNRFGWDEQGEEAKFDGADERLRTLDGRHDFALTPHKVEGRPDTGARSWIHSMLSGDTPKGHSISTHSVSIPEVPDWVYSQEAKVAACTKWIKEPLEQKNLKVLAEGRARFLGEWHETGGLFYDDWNREVHVIDDFQIPDDWTRYRAMDHGLNVHPTVCYDKETEILTDQGWKFFKDLDETEKVATVDKQLNLEYQKPDKYIGYKYSGDMMVNEDRCEGLNFSVTPNHRMVHYQSTYHKKHGSKEWTTSECQNLPSVKLPTPVAVNPIALGDAEAMMSIPHKFKCTHLDSVKRVDFAALLGWFIAEGTASTSGKANRVIKISQKIHLEKLRGVMNRLGWKYQTCIREDGLVTFSIQNGSLHDFLKPCCGDYKGAKRLPEYVWSWGRDSLEVLLAALEDGDGRTDYEKDGRRFSSRQYYTVCKGLSDDVQRLALILGYSTKIKKHKASQPNRRDHYSVSLFVSKNSNIRKRNIRKVPYDDMVYCVSVPQYKTLIVRRHGRPMICGNCLWAACSPLGDLYIYREYAETGRQVSKNCREIIKASGNSWETVGKKVDELAGIFCNKIRERFDKENYAATVLDSRSRNSTEAVMQITWDEIYRINGLRTTAASGHNEVDSAPAVREFMAIDVDREHLYNEGANGCSHLFVFRSCSGFIRQIENFARDEHASSKVAAKNDQKETARQKDKDIMDAFRYLCQIPPKYRQGRWAHWDKWEPEEEFVNRARIYKGARGRRKTRVGGI